MHILLISLVYRKYDDIYPDKGDFLYTCTGSAYTGRWNWLFGKPIHNSETFKSIIIIMTAWLRSETGCFKFIS